MVEAKKAKLQSIPIVEWIIGAIGALLTLAAIAYLVNEGWRGDQRPPVIAVTVTDIEQIRTGYRVRVKAHNEGGEAAGRVRIVGRLTTGGEDEIAETELDYVPAHSDRSAGLFFRGDPRVGQLELRATGYEVP